MVGVCASSTSMTATAMAANTHPSSNVAAKKVSYGFTIAIQRQDIECQYRRQQWQRCQRNVLSGSRMR